MAEPHFKQPSIPPQVPSNPPFTSGVLGFEDTFFGPNDKKLVDRRVREMSRVRGVDCYYYVQQDNTQRIDGNRPLTDGPDVIPEQTTRKRGGNVSLYGEPVIVRNRIDSTKREVVPDWNYAEPVLVRVIAMQPEKEEEPDERGQIVIRKLKLHIGRVLLDELNIKPRTGDVIRLPKLLDNFYDVGHVTTDSHRFGATGFYAAYELDLERKTMFVPERKLQGGA